MFTGDDMKIPKEISQLLARLESNGFEAFVVGGCVRDSLLGKTPVDWDICTSACPEDVQKLFTDYFVIPTGLKHGTITVVSKGMNVEITTYRLDGQYTDYRRPESVTYTKNLLEDLKRRDFTMNAMAYSPKSGLIDHFNGQEHLKQKLLCCVGDPFTRFSEDALRILRGLRFSTTHGLIIERNTAKAIHDCKSGLASISAERIYTELRKTLESPNFSRILVEYPDVLATLFPDAKEHFIFSDQWEKFMQKLAYLPESFPLRFASLLYWCHKCKNYPELCKSIIHQLKPDKKTQEHIMTLIDCQLLPFPDSLPETRRFLGRYGTQIFEELIAWRTVQFGEEHTQSKDFLKEILNNNLCCTIRDLAISGNHLQKLGLSGAEIGKALHMALNAVIESKVPNTEECLIKFLFS